MVTNAVGTRIPRVFIQVVESQNACPTATTKSFYSLARSGPEVIGANRLKTCSLHRRVNCGWSDDCVGIYIYIYAYTVINGNSYSKQHSARQWDNV